MQKSVIVRFNSVIEGLLDSNIVSSKREIAKKIGVSPSYFTEIMKGRIRLSADHIQKICTVFQLNPSIFFDTDNAYTPSLSIGNEGYDPYSTAPSKRNLTAKKGDMVNQTDVIDQLLEEKDRVITVQREVITTQQKAIALLEEKCADKPFK